MGFAMQAQQMRLVDIGVALRCRQAGMAEKLLDCPKVGTIAKKMRGKSMTECVWRNMCWKIQADS